MMIQKLVRKSTMPRRMICLCLALVMLLAVIPVTAPKTAAASTGKTLYLKPCDDWKIDNARFAAYIWDSNNNAIWVDAKAIGSDGYYKVEVPAGYVNIIFCRMNGSTTENNWGNKNNQTGDLTIPTDSKNAFIMDAGWNGTGTWSTIQVETERTYYLVGYFNGDNYNGMDYQFVDGKVTVTFEKTSYAYVMDSQKVEYMTNGYQGDGATSATLYSTTTISNGDKLYVPANVEVTFTLTNNNDGTLTLSYTVSGQSHEHSYTTSVTAPTCTAGGYTTYTCSCGHSYTDNAVAALGHNYENGTCTRCGAKEVTMPTYYLTGWINNGDCSNESYPIVNGTLTATFTSSTHVWIKDGSGNYYKTQSYVTATEGTFYKDRNYGEKMYVPLNVEVTFTLVENSDGSLTLSYTTSGGGSGSGGTVGTVVDLNTGTFEPDDGKLYVSTTFYDYYTNYELENKNLDSRIENFSDKSHYNVFGTFNAALSKYYDENDGVLSTSTPSNMVPIYVGHFQPDWSGYGEPFKGLGVKLYGFEDGRAYGSSSSAQKYFMSVNNSNMNLDPSMGHGNSAAWGIVADRLNDDHDLIAAGSTAVMPFFNKAFINGSSYSNNQKLGDVYENVQFPFTKEDRNGIMYWVFDSEDTTLEMKKDTEKNQYYLDDITNKNGNYQFQNYNANPSRLSTYGFFPFNEGADASYVTSYNYGFGARIDIPFNMTNDGMQEDMYGDKKPIIFEFSGDDDVWVFIDDQLVLDIGGSHGKVTGTINFATMTATVSGVKSSGGDHNPEDGDEREPGYQKGFSLGEDLAGEHILTMFYMERGMWESNMSIAFNFIPRAAVTSSITSFTVQKQWNVAQSDAIPASIDVQLQRRAEGTTEWEPVEDVGEKVTIKKPDTSTQSTQEVWSYTWDALDKFTNDTGFTQYEYRVMELDADGSVLANGATSNGMMVAYGEVYTGATGYVQLISNNQVENNIVVVVDYGLSVNVSVVDEGNGSLLGIGNTLKLPVGESTEKSEHLVNTLSLKHGTATVEGNKICYTLKDMLMDSAENIGFCYQLSNSSKYIYSTLTVIPATTIYYEDDFTGADGNAYITYDAFEFTPGTTENSDSNAVWTAVGDSVSYSQGEDRPGFNNNYDADNIYGYDGAYTLMSANSMGSAMKFTASKGADGKITYGTASFSFTGTGFDVISVTSGTTGTITVKVTYPGKDSEGKDIDITAKTKIVDTYYGYARNEETGEWAPADRATNADTLYQVPVIKISGLEYRTYDVTITVSYNEMFDHGQGGTDSEGNAICSYDFYLDAIRIYDPANDGKDNSVIQGAYTNDKEGWPEYFELRNLIIARDSLDYTNGNVVTNGVVFIDNVGTNDEFDVADYKNFGPNNELYLAPGQAIAFDLASPEKHAAIHMAMKSVGGTASVKLYTLEIGALTEFDLKVGDKSVSTISTATDLYYNISDLHGKTVVIKNSGTTGILSITNVKITYQSAHTDSIEQSYFNVPTNVQNILSQLNKTEDDTVVDTTATIKLTSASLSMEDEVLMNFYFKVTGVTAAMNGNVAENMGLLIWNSQPEANQVEYSKADSVVNGALYDSEGDRYMSYTPGIAAKNLGDEVYVCAYVKNGNEYSYSTVISYSPKKYCTNMLGKDTTSETQKKLCVALLNYGAAAQVYFNHNPYDLVNAGLSDKEKDVAAEYTNLEIKSAQAVNSAKVGSFATASGFTGKTASVSFDGAFAINYYFTPNQTVNGNVTFYYWNSVDYAAETELSAGNATGTITLTNTGTGRYWGQITGIAAKELDDTFYGVAVYTDNNGKQHCSGVVAYSINQYCIGKANGGNNLAALAQATAVYGYYADEYFTTEG